MTPNAAAERLQSTRNTLATTEQRAMLSARTEQRAMLSARMVAKQTLPCMFAVCVKYTGVLFQEVPFQASGNFNCTVPLDPRHINRMESRI